LSDAVVDKLLSGSVVGRGHEKQDEWQHFHMGIVIWDARSISRRVPPHVGSDVLGCGRFLCGNPHVGEIVGETIGGEVFLSGLSCGWVSGQGVLYYSAVRTGCVANSMVMMSTFLL